MPEDREFEQHQLDLAYDALKTFFEWRHHVLTRFFVVIGGVIASWQWLADEGLGVRVAVLMATSAFAFATALFDAINDTHIGNLYSLGARLETECGSVGPGVFETIGSRSRRLRYGGVLVVLYLSTACVFAVLALVNVLRA